MSTSYMTTRVTLQKEHLRGLHFQKRDATQAKLVRVTKGAAYDVAVDLKPGSTTFKRWYGVGLTEENIFNFSFQEILRFPL